MLPVLLKMFSRALNERVSPFMHKLILPCQSAFIKERNTMGGVIFLHGILHESWRRKQQGVVLNLDFEKASYKVNWEFLFHVLKKKDSMTLGWVGLTPLLKVGLLMRN